MQLRPSQSSLVKRRLLNYLILFESILLVGLTVIAVEVRHVGEDVAIENNLKEFVLLVAFPVIWLCCLSLFGAWDLMILDNHIDGYRRLMKSSFMTFLTFSSSSYLFKIQISRFVILFSLIGGTLIHLVLRWIFLRIVDQRLKKSDKDERWLVICENDLIDFDTQRFAEEKSATIKCIESFPAETEFSSWTDEVIFQTTLGNFDKVLLPRFEGFTPAQIESLSWSIQQTDSEFVVRDNLGLATSQGEVKFYAGFDWISIGTPNINNSRRVLKRVFDLAIALPSIVLLLPLAFLIAIVLRIDSKGPILFTQLRIGQDGAEFRFPKFRTMKPGSDGLRLDLLGRPDENMLNRYKQDPRITRFGRVLRRFSLDELPQLWCVLMGSMSLVGPRPILPEEAIQLGDFHFRRQIAKPGLTGIWQVSGRKETSWEERMAFDIKYIQEWTLALDLILIARTFKAIILGKGAV